MIVERRKAEVYSAYIHIINLMEMSNNRVYSKGIEDSILKLIKKYPEVLRMYNKKKQNIGMLAVEQRMFSVVSHILKDRTSLLHQDINNKNIGHYLAEIKSSWVREEYRREEDLVDELLLVILKDPSASLQVDKEGNNIGMKVAMRDSRKALKVALKNELASKQKNKKGKTIRDIAIENGLLLESERIKN